MNTSIRAKLQHKKPPITVSHERVIKFALKFHLKTRFILCPLYIFEKRLLQYIKFIY